jgi:hypothetical protein
MKVGEALLHRGIITKKQLNRALNIHVNTKKKLGEVLIELGYATEGQVTACLAEQFGYKVIDPLAVSPTRESLEAVPAGFAAANLVLPLDIDGSHICCAINDPIDLGLTDSLQQMTRRRVEVVLAERKPLQEAIKRAYAFAGFPLVECPSNAEQLVTSRRVARKRHQDRWDREALLVLASQISMPKPKRNWLGKRFG